MDLFSVPVGTVPQEDPEYAESGHLFPPGFFEKYQGKWVALSGWDILAVRDTEEELREELGKLRVGLTYFHVPSESDILIF